MRDETGIKFYTGLKEVWNFFDKLFLYQYPKLMQ